MRECAFEGCGRGVKAKGYCAAHYDQLRQGRTLKKLRQALPRSEKLEICRLPECSLKSDVMNLCSGHYEQQRRGKPFTPVRFQKRKNEPYLPCIAPDCERFSYCRGMCARHYNAVTTYNISIEQYVELFSSGCLICKTTTGRLHIDHDHSCCEVGSCGKCVRGVLCHRCNTAIGLFDEDVERMQDAIRYLSARSPNQWRMTRTDRMELDLL